MEAARLLYNRPSSKMVPKNSNKLKLAKIENVPVYQH